ncbi:unnamed protein product [marine sediment metagenome]|uniref:Uncharacterized protein n=1 Tax=marine sediment metagenome TaxID=412755 RepID=X1G841_9ZZZZ
MCLAIPGKIVSIDGNANMLLDVIILLFIGVAIISNAKYLVLSTIDKKKK